MQLLSRLLSSDAQSMACNYLWLVYCSSMLVLVGSSLMHSLPHCIMLCFGHVQIIDRRVRELFVKADMLPLDTPANEIVKAGYKLVCMYLQSALCVCIHASMHDTWTHDMGYLFWSRKLIRRVSWVLGSLCVYPLPSLCVYLCVNDMIETLNCVELIPVANW